MSYLRKFNTKSDYQDSLYDLPEGNVSLAGDEIVFREPYAKVGDVAYWDGSKVRITTLSKWDASLGTPVGVVVVPEGFAPDRRTRIIGLKPVDANGDQSDSHIGIAWGEIGINTSLSNYSKVPLTDNAGSTSSGSHNWGYLPSDSFTGATSFVDDKAKYCTDINYYIPSPYLGDMPNPEYYKTLEGGNALSDFNGLRNTQTLVNLGSDYVAANACWKYNDGSSDLQWYLPAMGELGYVIPRFNEINNTINTLGGIVSLGNNYFWSSTEFSNNSAYASNTNSGCVANGGKNDYNCVRPFALI